MVHSALLHIHDTYEALNNTLNNFKHLWVYQLARIDLNITYLLQQLYAMQELGSGHRADIHLILMELAKFADMRDAALGANTNTFPELADARAYAKKNVRYSPEYCVQYATGCPKANNCHRFHGTRDEHIAHLRAHRFAIKSRLCKNVMCRYGAVCPKFHGTFSDHLAYLYRCNYKRVPAPAQHRCTPTDCIYYHSSIEHTYWTNRYKSIQHTHV